MMFQTVSLPRPMIFMSAQDARGPEEEDDERTWRSALRYSAAAGWVTTVGTVLLRMAITMPALIT